MSTTTELQPGDVYTCLHAGLIWAGSVRGRGERITVTRDDSPDRLALILDGDAQVRRWGSVRLVPGAVTVDPWTTVGDPTWAEERETARKAAWAEPDPVRRGAALAAVEARFGPAAPTSRTIAAPVSSPHQRAYEADQKRLDNPEQVHRIQSVTIHPDEEVRPPRRDRTVF